MLKRCANCQEELPLHLFSKSVRWLDGYFPYCKPCRSLKAKESYRRNAAKRMARSRQYRAENIEAVREYDRARGAKRKAADPEAEKRRKREYQLRSKFGITLEQYDEILAAQGGTCYLCSKTPDDERRALAVDHDHKTGRIRGVLCYYCNNRVVGRHTDPDLLRRVADYLEQGTEYYVPVKKKKRAAKPRQAAKQPNRTQEVQKAQV